LSIRRAEKSCPSPEAGYRRKQGQELKPPTPGLFSFNNPMGACPACRGFGRVIGIDVDKALPDKSLLIAEGLVRAFQGDSHYECEEDLERCARARGLSLIEPYDEMSEEDQHWIIEGDGGDPEEAWQHGTWYGVRGFFDWMESRAYRMHVRVFLSRYRSYTTCKDCKGTRLKAGSSQLPRRRQNTARALASINRRSCRLLSPQSRFARKTPPQRCCTKEVSNRLGYLREVGLGYLNLGSANKNAFRRRN
jgi:excinuclease ABC subunit A